MKITSVNPFTGEVNGEFELLAFQEALEEIRKSRGAFYKWKELPVSERAALIKKAGAVLKKNARRYAKTITREMGKPISESLAEIEKCAWLCDYYSENAEQFLKDEIVRTDAKKSYVTFEPLGVILGIMPWNFPFWQVFRFAVPAIAAGNVAVLKHASNVPMSAEEIQGVFLEAGFPPYVFKALIMDPATAMRLIKEDRVDGVSLTGSVAAGSQIGEIAGSRIRKAVLELGGSDPFIVLEDADLDRAAEAAVKARLINAGQSCIAAKRFIVLEHVAREFTEKFIRRFREMRIGDPMDERTDIGPVARKEFLDTLDSQLDDARDKGAEIIMGPKPPAGGAFFQPAVVANADEGMRVAREETFGPIAPIFTAKDEDEAVRLANSTEFGLGAAVWSRDIGRAERMARKLQAGFVAINGMVRSDPRLPFGGMKKSGVGRELSHYGLKEFTNIKTVVVSGETKERSE